MPQYTLRDLNERTKVELRQIAMDDAGLDLPMAMDKPTMLARICVALGIEITNDPAPQADATPRGERRFLVTIHPSEKIPAAGLPLTVGGPDGWETVLVKPGFQVPLKEKFLKVLENAIETIYRRQVDPASGREVSVPMDVAAYPYAVHGPVSG